MKVLGLGNALVDIIIPVSADSILEKLRLPKGSMQLIDDSWLTEITTELAGTELELASGGSASNTIHGLASLGVTTGFVGSVGRDEMGGFFEKDLISKGIQPRLRYSDQMTGRAYAFVSLDSERTFGTYLGAALELAPEHIDSSMFAGYDWLYVEGYLVQNHQLIEKAVAQAKESELMVALDLASYNVVEDHKEFLEKLLRNYVDLVFANEEEARVITGQEPEKALLTLSDWCAEAVIKVGNKGSLVRWNNETIPVEPIVADPKDTSGAGDIYAAGFLFGKSRSLDPYTCGCIGSFLAGKVIEYYGPKLPLEAWGEILPHVKRLEVL